MVPQRDMPAPVWWPRMWNGAHLEGDAPEIKPRRPARARSLKEGLLAPGGGLAFRRDPRTGRTARRSEGASGHVLALDGAPGHRPRHDRRCRRCRLSRARPTRIGLARFRHISALDIRTKQEHCLHPREPDAPSGIAMWISKGKSCGPPVLDHLLLRPARRAGRLARTYLQGASGGDRRCLAAAVGGTGAKGGVSGKTGSPAAWRARRRLTAA